MYWAMQAQPAYRQAIADDKTYCQWGQPGDCTSQWQHICGEQEGLGKLEQLNTGEQQSAYRQVSSRDYSRQVGGNGCHSSSGPGVQLSRDVCATARKQLPARIAGLQWTTHRSEALAQLSLV